MLLLGGMENLTGTIQKVLILKKYKTIIMEGKICPKCKAYKEKKMFSKSTARTDRMAVYCKMCENAQRKAKAEERKRDAMFDIF